MPTAKEVIQQLINLKIDLIPIKPGGKIPMHAQWNVPTERTLSHVINSFTRSHGLASVDLSVEEFTKNVANFGVLNATSSVVTLDCDSPLAGKALQAACDALGGDFSTLYPETSWNSVKGQKAMFRRPTKLAAGRTMFKVFKGDGKFDVIFELRGTGQDVLPPSWREDAQHRLAWFHEPPTKIPTMPKWLVALYTELNAGKGGPAFEAMCGALELTPGQRARTYNTSQSMNGYPDYLLAHAEERAYVNGHFPVEDLLLHFGYQKDGKRFKPPGTNHAAGIVQPRNQTENWLCEHEGDVLAGVFDAWRVIVECEFNGDIAKAALSVRNDMLSALKTVDEKQVEQPSPPAAGKQQKAPKQPPQEPPVIAHSAVHEKPDDQEHSPEGQAVAVEVAEPEPRKPKPAAKPGRLKPPDNFLTERHETVRPILYGNLILSPGCHLLSAQPKSGKSTLLTAMALVASTGKSISGLRIDKPVPTLYCALDENIRQNLQPRIQRLAEMKDLPADLITDNLDMVASGAVLFDWARQEGIDCAAPLDIEAQPDEEFTEEELRAWSRLIRPAFNPYSRALYHYLRTYRVKFCVVDLITSMRMKSDQRSSVYERDMEEFMALNLIGVTAGCAIVGAHHQNKAAAGALVNANALAKVSGTNAISGAMQSIISLSAALDRGMDYQAMFDIEPKGAKAIIEQTSRDTEGMQAAAFSLVQTRLGGKWTENEPALEWTFMGPAEDALAKHDEKEFIRQFLFAKPPNEYTLASEIYNAAVAAGITNARSADSFRKLPQRMARAGHLDSKRGASSGTATSGFKLTDSMRARVKAKNDATGY